MLIFFIFILKSNLLEASPELMQRDSEKEWYYGNKEKERLGPFSFKEVSNSTSILLCPCLSLHVGVLKIGGESYGMATLQWTSISTWKE